MFTELKSREESLKKRLANDAITVKNRKRAREEQEFRLKLDCLEKVTNRIEDGIGQCKNSSKSQSMSLQLCGHT